MINKCEFCQEEFEIKANINRRFCSRKCYWNWMKGKSFKNKGQFKKGHIPWHKGMGKMLTCKTCGKKFRDKKWGNKLTYCSAECRRNGEWKKLVIKNLLMKSEDYTKEIRKKLSGSLKGSKSYLWKGGRPKCLDCGKQLKAYDAKRCRRCDLKNRMQNKQYLKNILKRREMSGLEKKLLKIINKFHLPYKFVGNGEFILGTKCPDFINTNGQKIAVEVYWDRHKEKFRKNGLNGWKEERTSIFKEYGWKIIFIEGKKLNEENVLNFLKGGG